MDKENRLIVLELVALLGATMEFVNDMASKAEAPEKEQSLREQYDRILQQKLQEQYQAFAKFNEDYISRNLKSHDLGYVS